MGRGWYSLAEEWLVEELFWLGPRVLSTSGEATQNESHQEIYSIKPTLTVGLEWHTLWTSSAWSYSGLWATVNVCGDEMVVVLTENNFIWSCGFSSCMSWNPTSMHNYPADFLVAMVRFASISAVLNWRDLHIHYSSSLSILAGQ